jgi:CHAT domain-containing protein
MMLSVLATEAAQGPEPEADPGGRFEQHLLTSRRLLSQGKPAAARSELEIARGLLPEVSALHARERATALDALIRLREGKLAEVDEILESLAPVVESKSAPLSLRVDFLEARAGVTYELGQHRQARRAFEELAKLAREAGQRRNELWFLNNAAASLAAEVSDQKGRAEVLARYRELLGRAEVADPRLLPALHGELGRLEGGAAGREHLERCLDLAKAADDRVRCLGGLAVELAPEAPGEARRRLGEAVELAHGSLAEQHNFWPLLYLWPDRMAVSWATAPRQQAIEECLEVLEGIEELRRRQQPGTIRAGFFSVWTEAYHWLAGRLLDVAPQSSASTTPDGAAPSRPSLELAFAVGERYRARVLSDSLEAADALSRDGGENPAEAPKFATLSEIEASLAEDEALLAYQVAPWTDLHGRFGGGSWLLAVHRSGTRAYRLDAAAKLEYGVRSYLGMLGQRDGSEAVLAETLYHLLLAPALADLPEGVGKLILVPDGELHLLPFSTLRETREGPPLALRFELSSVPSATLWRRWRTAGRGADAAALIFADPYPFSSGAGASVGSSGGLRIREELSPLPQAREEARAVAREVGSGSELRTGEEAAEHLLKTTPLARFGLLHLAVHAVVDTVHPERSAVHLAAGQGEDGRLEPREIVELGLRGQLVVLSACSSARGPVVRGEGVMSLARAFFQSGAATVVASLWPLEDREARIFFEDFYHHLAQGRSIRQALRLTQEARLKAGEPARAWAGVVVLGDGARTPLPGRRPPLWLWAAVAGLAAAGGLTAGGIFWRLATRRQPLAGPWLS